jgi:hypothetical protein
MLRRTLLTITHRPTGLSHLGRDRSLSLIAKEQNHTVPWIRIPRPLENSIVSMMLAYPVRCPARVRFREYRISEKTSQLIAFLHFEDADPGASACSVWSSGTVPATSSAVVG